MVWLDARLPIRFGPVESRAAHEALLTDEPGAAAPAAFFTAETTAHPAGCACCLPRSGAAQALAALFRDRALATGTPFRGVLAVVGPAGEAAVRAALSDDPVAAARYRLAEP